MAQHFAIFGLAFIFIVTGLTNRARKKGPWRAFLYGGVAMAALELLNFFGAVQQYF